MLHCLSSDNCYGKSASADSQKLTVFSNIAGSTFYVFTNIICTIAWVHFVIELSFEVIVLCQDAQGILVS